MYMHTGVPVVLGGQERVLDSWNRESLMVVCYRTSPLEEQQVLLTAESLFSDLLIYFGGTQSHIAQAGLETSHSLSR